MVQVLFFLLVFGLGMLVGNFLQPQVKHALLSSFLQDAPSLQMPQMPRVTLSPAPVSPVSPVAATAVRPTQLRVEGEFLKRDGRDVILELPPLLECDPLEHLLVINLQNDLGKSRRDYVREEFQRANLSGRFHFWSAVDAKTDPRLAEETRRGQCKPCETTLANSLSHREIWEMMLYERWPCATIFEDDVRLAPNFSLRVDETVGSIPPFDVILWGHCPGGSKPKEFEKDAGIKPLKLSYGWPGTCLHAYTVSLQGAFIFTGAGTPVRFSKDGYLNGMQKWHKSLRAHINKAKGQFTGAYWYASPMMAIQDTEADKMEGGAEADLDPV